MALPFSVTGSLVPPGLSGASSQKLLGISDVAPCRTHCAQASEGSEAREWNVGLVDVCVFARKCGRQGRLLRLACLPTVRMDTGHSWKQGISLVSFMAFALVYFGFLNATDPLVLPVYQML